MVVYTEEDKELVIPVGLGNLAGNNQEAYDNGFQDGHVSGVTEQKAKLVSTAITENGTYSRENGFNEVEVDVQPPLETLSVSQSGDVATYTPDEGYYGIGELTVDARYYGARRWQDGVAWKQEQIAQQAIALSFSGNGEWQKDFFDDIYANRVIVNVPIDEIYQSGYTKGYNDRGEVPSVNNFFSLGFILPFDSSNGFTRENIKTITGAYPLVYEGQPMAGIDINITHSGNTTEIWLTGSLNSGGFGELQSDTFTIEVNSPVTYPTSSANSNKIWVNAVEDSGNKIGGYRSSVYQINNFDTTITIYV